MMTGFSQKIYSTIQYIFSWNLTICTFLCFKGWGHIIVWLKIKWYSPPHWTGIVHKIWWAYYSDVDLHVYVWPLETPLKRLWVGYDRNKIRVSFYFDQSRVYIVHTQPKVFLIGFLGVIHRRWGQPQSNMLVKFYVHTYAVLTHLPPPNVCEDACGVNFTKIAGC